MSSKHNRIIFCSDEFVFASPEYKIYGTLLTEGGIIRFDLTAESGISVPQALRFLAGHAADGKDDLGDLMLFDDPLKLGFVVHGESRYAVADLIAVDIDKADGTVHEMIGVGKLACKVCAELTCADDADRHSCTRTGRGFMVMLIDEAVGVSRKNGEKQCERADGDCVPDTDIEAGDERIQNEPKYDERCDTGDHIRRHEADVCDRVRITPHVTVHAQNQTERKDADEQACRV